MFAVWTVDTGTCNSVNNVMLSIYSS